MPRRNDIHRILIVGSGPIVIGQACEFDYSGTQACKALRADGYEVILLNSNPATIMTDPNLADKTYIEPLTVDYAEQVIRRERPDALLSTVGGQTGLNLSVELAEKGILDLPSLPELPLVHAGAFEGLRLPRLPRCQDGGPEGVGRALDRPRVVDRATFGAQENAGVIGSFAQAKAVLLAHVHQSTIFRPESLEIKGKTLEEAANILPRQENVAGLP